MRRNKLFFVENVADFSFLSRQMGQMSSKTNVCLFTLFRLICWEIEKTKTMAIYLR